MKRLAVILMLVAAIACARQEKSRLPTATIDTLPGGVMTVTSPGPTAWTDTNGWKLVETLRLGSEGDDSLSFHDPSSLALDGEGRVFVSDESPATIKVFDREGHFIRTIGREGAGPGEYRVAFLAIHGSNLVVHDPRQSRTSVFDTSGAFIRSWASLCCYWTRITVDRDGRVYIPGPGPRDSGNMFIRYTLDGKAVDTLHLPREPEIKFWTFTSKQMSMMMSIPFMPSMENRVNPAGGFFVGMTDRYQIVESAKGRDTTRIFGRTWTATPVSDRRRQATVDSAIKNVGKSIGEDNARKEIDMGDVPSTAPAWTAIDVDGRGNRWLMTDPGEDSTHTWFDVFDSTGVYLGKVVGPPGLTAWRMVWSGDEMLAYVNDEEGTPMVVKYRIERGTNPPSGP